MTQTPVPAHELNLDELARLAFAAKNITAGLWQIGVKLRFGGSTSAWTDDSGVASFVPTGLMGVEGLALFSVSEPGPMVYDAASGKRVEPRLMTTSAVAPVPAPAKKRARK